MIHKLLVLTLDGISTGMIYAAVALALVLIWRATRVVNFAQGGMAMVTTYLALAVIEATHLYWLGFVAALVGGLVLGVMVERLVVRRVASGPPLNSVIVTLGLLLLLQAVAPMVFGGDIRSFPNAVSATGLSVGGTRIPFSPFDAFTMGSVFLTMLGLYGLFRYTNLGLQMRAAAFAPEVARLLGVRVGLMLTIGWGLAAMVGSLAGVLVAPVVLLSPNSLDPLLVFGFTAAILGGLDSPVGAIVGGLGLGLFEVMVGGFLSSDLEIPAALVLLVALLMIRPEGLFAGLRHRQV